MELIIEQAADCMEIATPTVEAVALAAPACAGGGGGGQRGVVHRARVGGRIHH